MILEDGGRVNTRQLAIRDAGPECQRRRDAVAIAASDQLTYWQMNFRSSMKMS